MPTARNVHPRFSRRLGGEPPAGRVNRVQIPGTCSTCELDLPPQRGVQLPRFCARLCTLSNLFAEGRHLPAQATTLSEREVRPEGIIKETLSRSRAL